jgi:hypothetical protein
MKALGSALADAFCAVEDGAGGIQLDDRSNQQEQGRDNQEAERSDHPIKDTLTHTRIAFKHRG